MITMNRISDDLMHYIGDYNIPRIGEFDKVPIAEFEKAIMEFLDENENRLTVEYFGLSKHSIAKISYQRIVKPARATAGSAGYDFCTPIGFKLKAGETIKIPTGICAKIDDGWFLGCLPRSGLGFKYKLQLDNTMGIIDSDYYYSDNGGHIFLKMTNNGDVDLTINFGDKIAQGIFMPFGITYEDNATGTRNGGFGSTDDKLKVHLLP